MPLLRVYIDLLRECNALSYPTGRSQSPRADPSPHVTPEVVANISKVRAERTGETFACSFPPDWNRIFRRLVSAHLPVSKEVMYLINPETVGAM